jgi:hypothetical protein
MNLDRYDLLTLLSAIDIVASDLKDQIANKSTTPGIRALCEIRVESYANLRERLLDELG